MAVYILRLTQQKKTASIREKKLFYTSIFPNNIFIWGVRVFELLKQNGGRESVIEIIKIFKFKIYL